MPKALAYIASYVLIRLSFEIFTPFHNVSPCSSNCPISGVLELSGFKAPDHARGAERLSAAFARERLCGLRAPAAFRRGHHLLEGRGVQRPGSCLGLERFHCKFCRLPRFLRSPARRRRRARAVDTGRFSRKAVLEQLSLTR